MRGSRTSSGPSRSCRRRNLGIPGLVLLLAACGERPPAEGPAAPPGDAAAAPIAELLPACLYPGQGIRLPTLERGLAYQLTSGRIVHGASGTWLVAPLDAGTVTLSIEGKSGEAKSEVCVTGSRALELHEAEASRIAGSYGAAAFAASLVQDGTVEAEITAGDESLSIRLTEPRHAALVYQGVEIDGYGKLNDGEQQVMEQLAASGLAQALTGIPLELRCVEADIPDEMLAALVFPWQAVLKYAVLDRSAVIRHFMTTTHCTGAETHYDVELQAEVSFTALRWDSDNPIPAVFPWFPFDGAGQLTGAAEAAGAR